VPSHIALAGRDQAVHQAQAFLLREETELAPPERISISQVYRENVGRPNAVEHEQKKRGLEKRAQLL